MTLCICGCGQEIIIKRHHKWYGIPKYIKGHCKNRLGKHHSEESKQKISKANSGENNFFYGKHHSEENRQKISKVHKGKYVSKETKQKISESLSGKKHPLYGKHLSNEIKQKISDKNRGKNNGNWQGGKSFEPYCEKWTNKIREQIRNQYDRKCYICKKLELDQIKEQKERGKRQFRLSVHHIDEDKEQGCNGKSWKLVPLCINCHNKLHHSKKLKLEIK